MLQPLDRLRRADETAGAAACRHALLAHGEAAADRALVGKLVPRRILWPAVEHDSDDLRNDVAGALHDYRVAPPHVLALDLVFVVQGGTLHDDAPDRHRLQ